MATKPLRSEDPNPKPVQFAHFGVLDTGARSKGAAVTSITINVAIAALIVILGMIVKNNPVVARKVAELTLPPKPPAEQPKPKPPPPPPPKPLPKPPIEPPKVKLPEPAKVLPPEIKPVEMPTPKPIVVTPPAPKKVDPPPAPKVVNLSQPKAAAIANNDAHPSAVRLGNTAIKSLNGPAVATKVNLGGGVPGMPASNTGNGPHATSVNLGSGAPGGTNLNGHDRAPAKIAGLSSGVTNGTGTGRNGPVAVQIKPAPVAVAQPAATPIRSMANPPVLISRPQPVYTAEAKAAHIEGKVGLNVTVLTNGTVKVNSVTRSLNPGLDESARRCMEAARFKPATDATGKPIDYTFQVAVTFTLN